MTPWFILYDGTSPDGRGVARYAGRTTDPSIARKHFEKTQSDPHSVGYVLVVTDTSSYRANGFTDWFQYEQPVSIR